MTKGNIVIEPYRIDHLSNTSYDVTLGENYFRGTTDRFSFNPWSKSQSMSYWGSALTASVAEKDNNLRLQAGEKYILIQPGELILAHTQEFIGGKHNITTMMKARSSMGRVGISVCDCAGWGDVNYFNRWTMEIHNKSTVPIVLPVGRRVAQIIFLWTTNPDETYRGKYQEIFDMEMLMNSWSPTAMLPGLYKDNP